MKTQSSVVSQGLTFASHRSNIFKKQDRILYARLWQIARPCHPHLAGISGLSLLSVLFSLLLPLPLKLAVDGVMGIRPEENPVLWWIPKALALPFFSWTANLSAASAGLIAALALLGVVALASQGQALASWYLHTYTGEKLVWDFRALLFAHAQRLSLLQHQERQPNDAAYRIQHDAPAIQNILIHGFIPVASSALMLVAITAAMLKVDWQLAFVGLTTVPFIYFLTTECGRRVRARSQEIKIWDSMAISVIHESLSSLAIVKAFSGEKREEKRFEVNFLRRMQGQVQLAITQGAFNVCIAAVCTMGIGASMIIGVRHVEAQSMTLGTLVLMMSYMAQLYEPMKLISAKISDLQSWMASIQRSFDLLDETPDVSDDPGGLALQHCSGEIHFHNVSYRYPGQELGIFNLTFSVPAGSCIGIVGPSGSGKTTVLNLLARFFDPCEGRIELDGMDIRRYRLCDLRQQFSFVLQEPVLFSTSLAENIAYGHLEASRREVITAAKAAAANDFIMNKDSGYETEIGPRGASLSGGERQRVSLARAYLKRSPMLILDEPTSALDVETEKAIIDAIPKLIQGRTTFIVAHRMSTLRHCDFILEMRDGRMVDFRGAESEGAAGQLPFLVSADLDEVQLIQG